MNEWLLLMYKVPRKPSAGRVHVWRKLKQAGAVLLHDAVWALPSNPRTEEQAQWLVDEIRQLHGEATLWSARMVLTEEEPVLVRQFQDRTRAAYGAILSALKGPSPDLAVLSRQYRQAQAQDFFPTPLSARIRKALLKAQRRPKG